MTTALENAAKMRLNEATEWLITEAAPALYSSPAIGISVQATLTERFQVRSFTRPALQPTSRTPHFTPISRGIFHDVSVVATQTFPNAYYEYWFIAVSRQAWGGSIPASAAFVVTEAASPSSRRAIRKRSETFFAHYEVDGKAVFDLPIRRDLALRYKLMPWLLPTAFPEFTDLRDEEILLAQNGAYIRRTFHHTESC